MMVHSSFLTIIGITISGQLQGEVAELPVELTAFLPQKPFSAAGGLPFLVPSLRHQQLVPAPCILPPAAHRGSASDLISRLLPVT